MDKDMGTESKSAKSDKFGLKIDIHTHILPTVLDIDKRLQANEFMGVSKCVLLSFAKSMPAINGIAPYTPGQACNDARLHPDNFIWFCNVDPRDDGFEKDLQAYKDQGAQGIGEFSSHIPFDCPEMDRLLSLCEEYDLPLLFHMAPDGSPNYYGVIDDPRLPRLERMLKKHPRAKIIGHSQPFWFEMADTEEVDSKVRNSFPIGKIKAKGRVWHLMEEYENLYCDLSANSGGNAIMRDPEFGLAFLSEFQDRILWGSDWCGGPFRYGLSAWLDFAMSSKQMDKSVYEKVCRDNAERLFGKRI